MSDFVIAVICSTLALQLRFGGNITPEYAALSVAFPLLWVMTLWLAGAYDARYIGTGSDEFRKVLNAGVSLTAGLAILSYAVNTELSRSYLMITMPSVTLLDLAVRFAMRKRLHKLRGLGRCMSSVLALGHEVAVADLITELRRDSYHGLSVVAACLTGESRSQTVAGVQVFGGLDDVGSAVRRCGADTVAVLSCNEIDGIALRRLAWELEKTGTDLCVAPSLLDVAGPRTTIRPTAGLTLLHVDHPQLTGPRLVLKEVFDRIAAGAALLLLSPVLAMVAMAIRLSDEGPALFTQTRVGKNGRPFKIYKFRTMVVDAEKRLAELRASNEFDGVLFKMRHDPRITGDRQAVAQVVARRAATAHQRVPRRDVARRPTARAPRRDGAIRRPCPAPAGGEARAYRDVAGQRPVGSFLGRDGATRPPLRRELVVRSRPADPVEDILGDLQGIRRVLTAAYQPPRTDRRVVSDA